MSIQTVLFFDPINTLKKFEKRTYMEECLCVVESWRELERAVRLTIRINILAPQIEYSACFTRFNKAYLVSLCKINCLTRGSDKKRIASRSPQHWL